MSAFFGAIGLVGFIVGIVLMIVGRVKKKKYYGWLVSLICLVIFIAALVTTPASETKPKHADQTSNYKVTAGKITNDDLLIALSVRSETTIEDYEKIDKVTVHQENIEAKKLPDMKDEDGKVYKNVYQVNGQYSWHDKRYNFEWIGSYNKNDVNTDKGYILKYTSEMSGTHVDVNLTPVK